MNIEELVDYLKIKIELSRTKTQKELAEKIGVSEQYLGDVLKFKRTPGKKFLDGIGFEKIETYRIKN